MTPQPPQEPTSSPLASLIPGFDPEPIVEQPQTDQLDDPLTDPLPERPSAPADTEREDEPAAAESVPDMSATQPIKLPPVDTNGVPLPRQQHPAVPVTAITTAPAVAPTVAPTEPSPAPEVRRFMSASDFLDRRIDSTEDGPASWGWQGGVRRWTGGLVSPRRGEAEVAYEKDRATIQQDFDGPRTIAFINPKGGAAKTTGVLAAGYTFGTVRGGGVVAWDNNETRGTLGMRGSRGNHRNTTRELLGDLERFSDVTQSRIGDLGAFVRSQGDAHFDVLASDERPDVTGTIKAQDFVEVHRLLERFYRIILVDTGNNLRAENWLAAAEAADLLVVTSTVREDTGYSGLWMLDALQDAGYPNLKHKTVTVLSDPSDAVDANLARDLVDVYGQRTRAVYRVPYDPVLVSGSVVPYNRFSRETRMSWLRACAGMAAAL
ncbi:conserved hypothetical protein [metagenome]|uniref:MinD-like ATPase involved in chromosome partitioning or flagellar assembly n=1 Tax=metagenome TaxID=256318 RepID=A0A2P2BY98_9ZZZZ